MTVELIIFVVLAAIAIAAALGMLLSSNAIYSALFLVVNFGVVATFYLLLGAPFIAMVQVTVYAGAIMVLFLFVIMLLGAEGLRHPNQELSWQQPLAVVLVLALLGFAGYVVSMQGLGVPPAEVANAVSYGSPAAIGQLLFREYLFPFEATSLLLLAAMVGVVVLTAVDERRRRGRPYRRS
mgnify:CR=1 FL=1